MLYKDLLSEAKALEKEFTEARRYLHAHAEIGFSLPYTTGYVFAKLREFGYTPKQCGRAGIVAEIGKSGGKTVLLRADMDALPMREETGLPFAARSGNMHACGHDMHTAMLLLAAKLLRAHENELCGTVKLAFQPAEETLSGAKDMIEGGLLESPSPDAAFMIHVISGANTPIGSLALPEGGIYAPSADYFDISVTGASCHGASPEKGADALLSAAHIMVALSEIPSRELAIGERAVLTVGKIESGGAENAISGKTVLSGTMRAYGNVLREKIQCRIGEISKNIAAAFRTEASVTFKSGCPSLRTDGALCKKIADYCREILPHEYVLPAELLGSVGGSEDFAYIAEKVPSCIASLSAGTGKYPLHHPKVCFDESVIPIGGAIYANTAVSWLEDNENGAK